MRLCARHGSDDPTLLHAALNAYSRRNAFDPDRRSLACSTGSTAIPPLSATRRLLRSRAGVTALRRSMIPKRKEWYCPRARPGSAGCERRRLIEPERQGIERRRKGDHLQAAHELADDLLAAEDAGA